MNKIGAWIVSMFVSLLMVIRVVIYQRDQSRKKAKQAQHEAEAQAAIRESEQRIASRQTEAQQKARQVEDEINQKRGHRPTDQFGDSRLHKQGKD